MDVWMPNLPMQATEIANPYKHTWTDAVSERVDFLMYVYFSMACVRENGVGLAAVLKTLPFAHPSIHTYIHTYIHTWIHGFSKKC